MRNNNLLLIASHGCEWDNIVCNACGLLVKYF